ncbi:MAG: hypothetical protein F6K28_19195 [Microcoleus sp. SIO2G3]|nr:hypothetical protein [Microcoleus sp. SIO2G3]
MTGAAGSKISLARHNWPDQFDGSAAGCCWTQRQSRRLNLWAVTLRMSSIEEKR